MDICAVVNGAGDVVHASGSTVVSKELWGAGASRVAQKLMVRQSGIGGLAASAVEEYVRIGATAVIYMFRAFRACCVHQLLD